MHYEIRPGVRGGRDQFNWNDLKTMDYKNREQYLGFSAKIGYLDKGGKWRNKDWYYRQTGQIKGSSQEEDLKNEIKRVQQEDYRRMMIKLGKIEPTEEDQPKLSAQEMEEIMQKLNQKNEEEEQERIYQNIDKTDEDEIKYHGLGKGGQDLQGKLDSKLKNKDTLLGNNIHRLEGTIQTTKENKQEKNMQMHQQEGRIKEEIENRKNFQKQDVQQRKSGSLLEGINLKEILKKTIKKEKKKEKKEKKDKKEKKSKKDKKKKHNNKKRHDTDSEDSSSNSGISN